MSEVHGEGYACGHCGKQFQKRKHLNSHIARVRKSLKKRTKHIYFEHEMTLPGAENTGDNPENDQEEESKHESSEDS